MCPSRRSRRLSRHDEHRHVERVAHVVAEARVGLPRAGGGPARSLSVSSHTHARWLAIGRRTPSTTWLDAKRAVAMTEAARPARSFRIASPSEEKSGWPAPSPCGVIIGPRIAPRGKYARITG